MPDSRKIEERRFSIFLLSRFNTASPPTGNCHAKRSGTSKRSARSVAATRLVFLSNGQLCLEKVVTNSEQSGITMTACQANAQMGIADWLANGPYHEWKLEGYKCVLGKYTAKHDA
jgi:hypothetical protein